MDTIGSVIIDLGEHGNQARVWLDGTEVSGGSTTIELHIEAGVGYECSIEGYDGPAPEVHIVGKEVEAIGAPPKKKKAAAKRAAPKE